MSIKFTFLKAIKVFHIMDVIWIISKLNRKRFWMFLFIIQYLFPFYAKNAIPHHVAFFTKSQ
jgi:hypothetical protein